MNSTLLFLAILNIEAPLEAGWSEPKSSAVILSEEIPFFNKKSFTDLDL